MILSIHQPSYFPWLGLLHKINLTNHYVLMDEVQLAMKTFQNRNVLLDLNGEQRFIVIPVLSKDHHQTTIKDIKTADNFWQKKHRKFIEFNYGKHPYFDEIYPQIEFIFNNNYIFLIDILIASMKTAFNMLNINVKFIRMSELNYNRSLKGKDLVFELLSTLKPDKYISGIGASNFISPEDYTANGINMQYQVFSHPVYKQKNSKSEFIEGLSCLDLLFNLGTAKSTELIHSI
jgi:hypothetical protein